MFIHSHTAVVSQTKADINDNRCQSDRPGRLQPWVSPTAIHLWSELIRVPCVHHTTACPSLENAPSQRSTKINSC